MQKELLNFQASVSTVILTPIVQETTTATTSITSDTASPPTTTPASSATIESIRLADSPLADVTTMESSSQESTSTTSSTTTTAKAATTTTAFPESNFVFKNFDSENEFSHKELDDWNPFEEAKVVKAKNFPNGKVNPARQSRNDVLPKPVFDDDDGSDDAKRHFAFHDICKDENGTVCATVGVVLICLCTSGIYAAIYTAYQVNTLTIEGDAINKF